MLATRLAGSWHMLGRNLIGIRTRSYCVAMHILILLVSKLVPAIFHDLIDVVLSISVVVKVII